MGGGRGMQKIDPYQYVAREIDPKIINELHNQGHNLREISAIIHKPTEYIFDVLVKEAEDYEPDCYKNTKEIEEL